MRYSSETLIGNLGSAGHAEFSTLDRRALLSNGQADVLGGLSETCRPSHEGEPAAVIRSLWWWSVSRVEWSVAEPGAVERLVGIFLCRENPNANRIRPSVGDGGIDVLVPSRNDQRTVTVYQVKYFHQNLTKKQKGQIERSYRRVQDFAASEGLTIAAWYLTLPLEPTNENRKWFLDLTQNAAFPCDWRGLDYLDSLAAKYPDVVDYYLHDGKQRLEHAIVALTNVLRLQQRIPAANGEVPGSQLPAVNLQPSEIVDGLSALHDILNKHDPHFRYDFSVDHERPEIPDAPFLLAAFQQGDEHRCVTFKIFARYAEAVIERPVPGSAQITAEPGSDLHRDLELFERYGRPFEAPIGSVTANVDLPGGLGQPIEGGALKIGLAATTVADNELRISIVDEGGTVLAQPLVKMQPVIRGQSGQGARAYGIEEHGAFTIEILIDLDTRNTQIILSTGDLAGHRPAELLEGLRLLAHFRPPHQMAVRPAYGPAKGEAIEIPETLAISQPASELLDLAEALATLQEHTSTRVEMPDLNQFTHQQMAEVLETARLLRGETLTTPWTSIGPVHLHPGIEPQLDARFAARWQTPLQVELPGGEIHVGIRNIDMPAARVDPESVTVHNDHKDIQLIPAGNAAAVVTYLAADDAAVRPGTDS